MTQPPVHYINNAMRGAPVLSGTRGSLIALLEAFLVTGFGQVTANSVTVAGGVATASLQPGEGFALHANVLVAGATPAALNGVARVIEATDTAIKFATSAPDGLATGAITIRVAPVGWQKVFTATNKAVFRSSDVQGARHYLRIDETGTANFARVRGYAAMTTVDAGTGLYPTNTQVNGGGYWVKSTQASASAIPYDLIADSRFLLVQLSAGFPDYGDSNGATIRGFGDPLTLKLAGDPYASCLSVSETADASLQFGGFERNAWSTYGSVYAARTSAGTGTAVVMYIRSYVGSDDCVSGSDTTLGPFPSSVDGELKLSRRYLIQSNSAPRADIPGLLHVPQSGLLASAIQRRDFIEGAGPLAGRVLLALHIGQYSGGTDGVSFVDITGPWR